MKTLRLILGDQLNALHSWFKEPDPTVVFVMLEMRQETDYVLHHAQKILAIFAAMREFANHLEEQGHRVHYQKISSKNASLTETLKELIEGFHAEQFEYLEPDEWRLDQQLQSFCKSLNIPSTCHSTEHFLVERLGVRDFFGERKKWLMETFYRHMRLKLHLLLDSENQPVGGAWNYDSENRKPWKGNPLEPSDTRPMHNHQLLWEEIQNAGVKSFGNPSESEFRWPINRNEALHMLDDFIQHRLSHFGDFQDALAVKHWRLFHALLSFALNTKMLHPLETVEAAEKAWQMKRAPLASVEGFIRQIIGWREYIRGVYWSNMPGYEKKNFFDHHTDLPAWFWTGQTNMRCMASSIGQSLDYAYAHHIQRLMIIGNFSLLAGLDPEKVHQWYLGVYIDAFEWVELPNTLGMSQFADGGLLATKPYVSSAAYIDRMGDYCKNCSYDKKKRIGENACPMNALYWDFFMRHHDRLSQNPRIGMTYQTLKKMSLEEKQAIQNQAALTLSKMEFL
jgi:deoxyribodipyrimidine photolyase-related protein